MVAINELYDEADRLKSDGNHQEAIEKLNQCLQIDPHYPLAHSALAVNYQKMGEHDKAIEHARRVCELAPDDPFSFTALSVTYQRAFAGTGQQQYIQMAEDAMARAHTIEGGG